MVFYAYIKNINDDVTWRYVIVFATSAVADEWWLAVSTSTNTKYANGVKRITAEYYTHDITTVNASASLTDTTVASSLIGSVFFTLLPDRDGRALSVIPIQDLTDSVSGNSFFIRSKAAPSEFWYCPGSSTGDVAPNSKVYVSRTERTRFRIRLINERKDGKGTIMIGSDEVAITLTSNDLSVRVSDNSQLIVSKSPELGLKFGDLVNGFMAGATLWNQNGQTEGMKELFKTGDGEKWELV